MISESPDTRLDVIREQADRITRPVPPFVMGEGPGPEIALLPRPAISPDLLESIAQRAAEIVLDTMLSATQRAREEMT